MDTERNEVYERIPWETLEAKGGDRQWWMFALAAAIVLGALAYSFMSNRAPAEPQAAVGPPEATLPPVSVTVAAVVSPVAPPPPAAPVVAESDLYAVDPERLIDLAAAQAEWVAAEFVGVDGSDTSRAALAALLPAGLVIPEPPASVRVFVEWVRAMEVEEIASGRYRVRVLVRSLRADGEEAYQRQPPMIATVEVEVGENGVRAVMPPTLEPAPTSEQLPLALQEVPPEIQAQLGEVEIQGGIPLPSGGWQVVIDAPGPDGLVRSMTVTLP